MAPRPIEASKLSVERGSGGGTTDADVVSGTRAFGFRFATGAVLQAGPDDCTRNVGRVRNRPGWIADETLATGRVNITCVTMLEVETPHGQANVHLHPVDEPRAALVLGHGAAGGVTSRDLVAVTGVAREEGVTVALVEQPYRVAGRRSPAPARQLDAAWIAVVEHLVAGELRGLPLVTGGRSLGARVACRTAEATEAVGVLCLAFPVHPPGKPEKTRLDELDGVPVPVLVVQGDRDPFGMPPDADGREVVAIPGTHTLRSTSRIAAAVTGWMQPRLGAA